ncbi:gluconate 2-dehydrogenase subunit 3 family protein [Pseudaminobacter sp. 19-2017]|uniref:Gluconate 2-dehydrogenase subunit 3 family protein n=1 Tax=Pseudaminobacter soli (ex Zhang et al. 2022) TaxID=2831468 RepID=A0A942DWE1_9HYPH|nr:gluconate 2-dehydrogenase subunit 3 family protein [Pseudaminobacter soli]MBS3647827.1 gluconate 2-dehydrogenase subunit 3 family protein [Pseudaminobacter soli]
MHLTRYGRSLRTHLPRARNGDLRGNATAGASYARYDVLAKWDTPSFDDLTRSVIAARLEEVPPICFLSPDEVRLLDLVLARLLPQPERSRPIPITPWIDDMLNRNQGEGYRLDGLPPLRETWRKGLAALAAEAALTGPGGFSGMSKTEQDRLLRNVQLGEVLAEWPVPAAHFFTHVLLKTAADIYYSYPDAWSEIGFGGPASPRGYVRLGFDERDSWEAKRA